MLKSKEWKKHEKAQLVAVCNKTQTLLQTVWVGNSQLAFESSLQNWGSASFTFATVRRAETLGCGYIIFV